MRGILVCRTRIALTLLARGQVEERAQANDLLCFALTDARRLRIPEAQQIKEDSAAGRNGLLLVGFIESAGFVLEPSPRITQIDVNKIPPFGSG